MSEFKFFRDLIIILACLFVIVHIWSLHPGADQIKRDRAKAIINQELGIQ